MCKAGLHIRRPLRSRVPWACEGVWCYLWNKTISNGHRAMSNGKRATSNGKRATSNGQRATSNGQRTTTNGQRTCVLFRNVPGYPPRCQASGHIDTPALMVQTQCPCTTTGSYGPPPNKGKRPPSLYPPDPPVGSFPASLGRDLGCSGEIWEIGKPFQILQFLKLSGGPGQNSENLRNTLPFRKKANPLSRNFAGVTASPYWRQVLSNFPMPRKQKKRKQ